MEGLRLTMCNASPKPSARRIVRSHIQVTRSYEEAGGNDCPLLAVFQRPPPFNDRYRCPCENRDTAGSATREQDVPSAVAARLPQPAPAAHRVRLPHPSAILPPRRPAESRGLQLPIHH